MKRFKYLTLAALVAFAACDEEEAPIVTPTPTGTISGVVTIEGVGASGVTVTLSSGSTATTDGSGAYAFSNVAAGAYTVTISGFASDATFTSTAAAATISTSGQVVTVNFSGSYIRTSAILGSVAAGGVGLSGVTVSIGSSSTTTDTNGQYAFSGLRAGSYTVTMSGFDASQYTFSSTSESVTVGVGESKVVSFSGDLLTTAKVMGYMFIDENDNNDTYDGAALEEFLTVANVTVTLEGGAVNSTMTTETDANGYYEFMGLAAGTYRVTLSTADTDLPGMVAFGLASASQLVTVTTGATGTVHWPFNISTQTIKVYGFLGTDADVSTNPGPGLNPIEDWTINLYDTQANAAAGLATGRLGSVDTDEMGESVFRFDRADDVSPNSSENDQVVFAHVAGAPSGTHSMLGSETIIEIKYAATDSMGMAPDTFDAIYNQVIIKAHAEEIDADTLTGWQINVQAEKDSAQGGVNGLVTDADGDVYFTITPAFILAQGAGNTDATLPDTLWFRLATVQGGAGGHAWAQTPDAMDGMAMGRFIRYIWDGSVAATDTVDIGSFDVSYLDSDVTVRVHRERDDSTDVATYSTLDDLVSVTVTNVELFEIEDDGTKTSVAAAAPANPGVPAGGTGQFTWTNIDTSKDYEVRARSTVGSYVVLNDTVIALDLDGSDQTFEDETLEGSQGASTFAIKQDANTVSGSVLGKDGATGAEDIIVTLMPTADNIQGTAMMVDTTDAAGAYAFTGIREGPYTVSVADIAGTWEFFDTLETTSAPTTSGSADNTDAMNATRDVQGAGVNLIANFQPHRMDTKIEGVVVNDRDSDFNTLDPDEALSGVTIELYQDTANIGVLDAAEPLVATTTTDANGAYGFEDLMEDTYIVKAISPSNATVLRELSGTGAVTNTAAAATASTVGAGVTLNQQNTRQVGDMDPPGQDDEFPRWNYLTGEADEESGGIGCGPNCGADGINNAAGTGDDLLTTNPTHFVHLFNTGTVTGEVTDGTTGVSGLRVTITRCQTSATQPSPPAGGTCTAKHGTPSPHIQNVDTDTDGKYTFSNLLEGVYQIDIAPATAGYTNITAPAAGAYLATLKGDNDIETVPDFTVS